MPDKKSPYNYIKGKVETPVQALNRVWHEWLPVRTKYETIWKRAHNQLISKQDEPASGFSNFYIDITRSQARTAAIQTWMNLFGEPPYVEYDPKGQEDITDVRIAEALTLHAMNEGHLPEEMWHCILGMFAYGFYTMKHTYERFTKKYRPPIPIMETVGFDGLGRPIQEIVDYDYKNGPMLEDLVFEGIWYSARSPFRTVIDPAAYNFSRGRMRGVIDTETRVPLERLLEMEKQGIIYGVKKNIDKLANGYMDCFQYGSNDPAEKDFQNSDQSKEGLVFIREYYDEINNTKTVVANWDVELFHDYRCDTFGAPLTCFSLYNIPQQVYAMGIPEQLRYIQKYVNTMAGLHIDELALRVHTPLFVRTGSGFRSKVHRIEPGQIYEIAGIPREAAYPLERPSHQAETWDSINRMRDLSQDATGISRITEGFVSNPSDTATQASIAANQAQGFITFLTMFSSLRLGDMGVHNVRMMNQLMSSKEIRISLPNELEPRSEIIRPGGFATNISPRLRMRSHSANRAERMQILLGLFDRLAPFGQMQLDPKTMQITPGLVDLRELIQTILKEAAFPGWQRVITGGAQNIDPYNAPQGLGQSFNQMRGMGGMANPMQPNMVPYGQQNGNRLGQAASQANPFSNNRLNSTPNELAGIL